MLAPVINGYLFFSNSTENSIIDLSKLFVKDASISLVDRIDRFAEHLLRWSLIPVGHRIEHMNPSYVYGIVHFLRLCGTVSFFS